MDTGTWGYLIKTYNSRALTSTEEWNLEKSFNEDVAFTWVRENYPLAFKLCALYVVVVFGLQYYMESRPRFDLRKPLLCWSTSLAVFSIIGSIRCLISFAAVYSDSGFRGTICKNTFYVGPVSRFWGMVFCLSKAPELVDTIFIVLRKQKLIFLHWYHHITVLLFSWYCYEGQRAGGAIFMTMNFVVHAMMYSYYALRAARVRVPRFVALIVTSCQILQMLIGCLTFLKIYEWRNDADCLTGDKHLMYGGLMYLSYLVLFCHFFYTAYVKPADASPQKSKKQSTPGTVETAFKKSMAVPSFTENMGDTGAYNLRNRKKISTS